MKKILLFVVFVITSLSAFAVKLNHRGEKMVSKLTVDFSAGGCYTIKFHYNSSDEINSLKYECISKYKDYTETLTVFMERDKSGSITREDHYNGEIARQYKIKIDSLQRPVETQRWVKDYSGNFIESWKFIYEYDTNGYDLSILGINNGEGSIQRRDCVKMINGCANITYYRVDLNSGREEKINTAYGIPEYGDIKNDLNIDPSQIYFGFAGVSDTFGPDMNYLSLVGWIPLKSKYFPGEVNYDTIKYEYDNDSNIIKISIIKKQPYSITIEYVR